MTCLHGKTPGVRIIVAPTVSSNKKRFLAQDLGQVAIHTAMQEWGENTG